MNALRMLVCLFASCLIAAGPVRSQETDKEISNSIGMKLVRIPAGKFVMGSPANELERQDNEQQHEVAITRPFHLGVYTVTQGQYLKVMGKNPSFFHPRNGGSLDHPVEQVRWGEARDFCARLSARPEEQKAGRTYRLPSEAEWEYACRAGTTTAFNSGDTLSSNQANFNGNFPYGGAGGAEKGPFLRRTAKVGSYAPNAWGLYDMHGNVFEWCNDWYDPEYYKKSPKENPKGPETGVMPTGFGKNFFVVVRGGCWLDEARACRAARRFRLQQSEPYRWTGLRVACDVAGKWRCPGALRSEDSASRLINIGGFQRAPEGDLMKNALRSVSAAVLSVLAALPWWVITWTVLNGISALLGVAGSVTATAVSGWIAPVLICASLLLIGRSFYVIYVRGIRTQATVVIAWCALVFMVGFWAWWLAMGSG